MAINTPKLHFRSMGELIGVVETNTGVACRPKAKRAVDQLTSIPASAAPLLIVIRQEEKYVMGLTTSCGSALGVTMAV
jgi:hypothetical protein